MTITEIEGGKDDLLFPNLMARKQALNQKQRKPEGPHNHQPHQRSRGQPPHQPLPVDRDYSRGNPLQSTPQTAQAQRPHSADTTAL